MKITNAGILLGVQGTTSTAFEPNESFSLSLESGVLTKRCATSSGPVGWALIPGDAGATRPASLGWNDAASVVTMHIDSPYGKVELVFARETP